MELHKLHSLVYSQELYTYIYLTTELHTLHSLVYSQELYTYNKYVMHAALVMQGVSATLDP